MKYYQKTKNIVTMIGIVTVLGASILVTGQTVQGMSTVIHGITSKSGELLWSDEFDETSIDPLKWNNSPDPYGEVYGSHIPMYYKPKLAKIENGNLVITTEVDVNAKNGFWQTLQSAYLSTKGLIAFQNGRIDIRAKLPKGQGIVVFGSLLGEQDIWPLCGEIGIFDNYSLTDKSNIFQSIYTKQFNGISSSEEAKSKKSELSSSNTEYHTYSIE